MPPEIRSNDFHTRRELPEGVLNIFSATSRDFQIHKEENFAFLKGRLSVTVPALSSRLWFLGLWISKISNQPAAVWWASSQAGIHPSIQSQIRYYLGRKKQDCLFEVRQAWRYIFKTWGEKRNDSHDDGYQLKASIDLDGWTNIAIKEFAMIRRPYLKAEKPYFYGPKPPENKKGIRIEGMVHLDVEYPWSGIDIQIPDEFLVFAIREFRKNLECAAFLENELGGFGLSELCPIEPDPDIVGRSITRTYGLSRLYLFFVNLMRRLITKDPAFAKQEFLAWWPEEEKIFARLRIWMSGHQCLFSGKEAGRIICNLSDLVFWDGRHQRDLLLVLNKRWNDFSAATRTRIEKRLLKGPSRWKGEEESEFIERRARETLNRIHWLKNNGCRFTFDIDEETERLKKLAPNWQLEYAEKAATSLEGTGGTVSTETQYSEFLDEPMETLLDKVEEVTKTLHERFVKRDPFIGLATEKPEIAIAVLSHEAKSKEYRGWAWRKFLTLDARISDPPEIIIAIIDLILDMPQIKLSELMYPISHWILSLSVLLINDCPEQFERIWEKLIQVLKIDSNVGESSIVRGKKKPEWATDARNGPVSNLVKTLMNDPEIANLKPGDGFPKHWIGRIEDCLELKGDFRQHALVMFAYHLNKFYEIDPDWTENQLISVLDQKGNDKKAFWAGFFWHPKLQDKELYWRLKPFLLRLACFQPGGRRSEINTQFLSDILLSGWESIEPKTGKRFVSNDEMRKALLDSDEEFRIKTLWLLERRIAKEITGRGKKSYEENFLIFLSDVWPRQKKVKSPKITANLIKLAFSNAANFSKIVDLVLPFVAEIERNFHGFYSLEKKKSDIVDQYPEKTLKLVHGVLTENVSEWPYGVEEVLERIGIADPALLKDRRLVELKRRWRSGY